VWFILRHRYNSVISMLFCYRLRSMLPYASAVLFYAVNTAVAFFAASYDVVVVIERYGRLLYRVVVSRRVSIDSHSNSHVNYTQLVYVYANRAYNLWNLEALCMADT